MFKIAILVKSQPLTVIKPLAFKIHRRPHICNLHRMQFYNRYNFCTNFIDFQKYFCIQKMKYLFTTPLAMFAKDTKFAHFRQRWIVVKDSVTAHIVERVVITSIWSGTRTRFERSARRQHTVVSNVKRQITRHLPCERYHWKMVEITVLELLEIWYKYYKLQFLQLELIEHIFINKTKNTTSDNCYGSTPSLKEMGHDHTIKR